MTQPLHILLLASAVVSAALTGSWIPIAVGALAEAIWLLVFARSGRRAAPGKLPALRDQQARLSRVSEPLRRRFLELDLKKNEIRRLALSREGLAREVLAPELDKVEGLVDRFLDFAVRATELEAIVEDQAGVGAADADGVSSALRTALEVLERLERGILSIRNKIATLGSPEELERDVEEVFRSLDAAARAVNETEAVARRAAHPSTRLKH